MLHVPVLHRIALPTLLAALFFLGCGSNTKTRSTGDSAVEDNTTIDTAASMDALPFHPDSASRERQGAMDDAEAVLHVDGGAASSDADTPDSGNELPPLDAGADTQKAQLAATVVVLPDTQYYASSYPDVFNLQTEWIVAQKSALNVAVALHVGDIVDGDSTIQWTVANPAMRVLDNVVPYDVVPGNHDYRSLDRETMMDNYFAPSSMPWVTGTMTSGQIENNYMLVDIGPQKWLVVGIEFGARDSVVQWADKVLKAYAAYPAILLTHAYLYADGTRYNIAVGGTDSSKSPPYQYWNPQYYGFTASDGINDGESMWQKLVLPNSNVKLVFCGHQTGWARLTSSRPDGTTVHQMLSDYQWLDGQNFGFGYLRVVQLDYDKKKIEVKTYSPYLDQYKDDDDNQFTLDLNL